jgi:hypothetical protein
MHRSRSLALAALPRLRPDESAAVPPYSVVRIIWPGEVNF